MTFRTQHKHKQSNELSLPQRDDYKTRKDTKYSITEQRPNTKPSQTFGSNNE